jgi:ATP-binding cassette subfamily F protein 3
LRSTVNEFYLVADKKLLPFEGDLTDYQNWLLQYREQQQNLVQGPEIKKEKPKQISLAEQRQHKKDIQKLERELQKAQVELESIMQILADPSIYAKEKQDELKTCLDKKRALENKVKDLEHDWFLLQEK